MNKSFYLFLFFFSMNHVCAQADSSMFHLLSNVKYDSVETNKKDRRPIKNVFAGSILIESQTVTTPVQNSLEFIIHHRMGQIKEASDLFGLYAASNIRLGLDYGITNRLMVGIGTEKNNKLQELQWKYALLRQTRSGSSPISISYYGNVAVNAQNFENYPDFKFIHRLSYYHQLLFARKESENLSFQLSVSFAHFNAIDSTHQNEKMGIGVGLRYIFYHSTAFIVEYENPILLQKLQSYQVQTYPNLSFGFEIKSSTHVFQVFATTYNNIIPQQNLIYNTNDFTAREVFIGFNITVRF